MKRSCARIALFLSLVIAPAICSADVISWTGPSDFDDEQILFPGFVANQLAGITSGDAYFHDHGLSATFTLSILLNGAWTEISSISTGSDEEDHPVAEFAALPVTFAPGLVTGLALTINTTVSSGYHGFSESTQFDFGPAVPEPSTYALWGSGLVALGALRLKRRRIGLTKN